VLFNKSQTSLIKYPASKGGSYIIPNGVTNIGRSAFSAASTLTNVTIANSVSNIGEAAFGGCTSLISVTIPNRVTSLGGFLFAGCSGLTGLYFQGSAPRLDYEDWFGADKATIYYLPGTSGWGMTFAERPTALWRPRVETSGESFSVRTNQFGFNITWASGMAVVVEASASLADPIWFPVGTNSLTDGTTYFSDPQWTNYPARLYRLRSQ